MYTYANYNNLYFKLPFKLLNRYKKYVDSSLVLRSHLKWLSTLYGLYKKKKVVMIETFKSRKSFNGIIAKSYNQNEYFSRCEQTVAFFPE